MEVRINPEVLELYPQLRLGVLLVEGVDNRAEVDVTRRLADAQDAVRGRFEGALVTEHPLIECWRVAYRAFGAKPKKYPSSIESLVRRTLRGEPLRRINPLVDLYNVISLEHLIPVGGEDIEALRGDLVLARAGASEPPAALLGEREARPPAEGEVFYTDDEGPVCRRLNWKEADRTKLTEATRRALLVMEALPPISAADLPNALEALERLVVSSLGGASATWVLDARQPRAQIALAS